MSARRLGNILVFAGIITILTCLGLTGAQGVDRQLILTACSGILLCIFTAHLVLTRRRLQLEKRLMRRMCRRMRQIGAARDAALASGLAKSAYFAGTSHEIRTPMNGVLGMIDVLLAGPLTADQKTYAEVMRESCCDLLAMLNDVLDFAKLDAGKLDLESIAFDLEAMVRRTVLLMQPQAQEKGLALVWTVDPALSGRFTGDPARIRQILLNLIGNAVKFTHSGEVRLRIAPQPGTDPAMLRFVVEDTGCGIPPEAQSRLFQEFSQLDPAVSRTHGGSGLGLAICRMLTERMGGAIGCDSQIGKGSAFWFTLPLAAAGADAPMAEESYAPAEHMPPCRILLAEDNRANQLYMHALLTRMGHKVRIVSGGAAAVAALRQESFDCVLMDLQMPGLDGASAARQIRALPAPGNHVAIIGLSADADGMTRQRVIDAGMNDFLVKPVSPADLKSRLVQYVTDARAAAPAVLPVSLPVLDFHQLGSLETVLPETSLAELISMFLSEAAKYLGSIDIARRQGDLAGAGHMAHQLVSMAGNLGAMEMSMLARRFERACAEKDQDLAEQLSRALSVASAKATAALATRLGARGGPARQAAQK